MPKIAHTHVCNILFIKGIHLFCKNKKIYAIFNKIYCINLRKI